MKKLIAYLFFFSMTTSCVVVPVTDTGKINKCEISSDRKTLKVVDIAKESSTYYSISGVVLLPLSAIVSGTYVSINNVYHLGEEKLVCG